MAVSTKLEQSITKLDKYSEPEGLKSMESVRSRVSMIKDNTKDESSIPVKLAEIEILAEDWRKLMNRVDKVRKDGAQWTTA